MTKVFGNFSYDIEVDRGAEDLVYDITVNVNHQNGSFSVMPDHTSKFVRKLRENPLENHVMSTLNGNFDFGFLNGIFSVKMSHYGPGDKGRTTYLIAENEQDWLDMVASLLDEIDNL